MTASVFCVPWLYRQSKRLVLVLALLLVATALLIPASVFAGEGGRFADAAGHWAEAEIIILAANGIVSGYPDGAFRPDLPVTRAELVKMLVESLRLGSEARRLVGADLPALYPDVRSGDWFLPFLVVASERGLVRGYDDGTFQASRPVTRAEIAALLRRALPSDLGVGDPSYFADHDQIPAWAESHIYDLVSLGIIRGYEDGSFRPEDGATRAEVAVIVTRLLAWRGDLFQLRGTLSGWVVKDPLLDAVPESVLVAFDGQFEMVVDVSDRLQSLSPEGLVDWHAWRPGQELGLVMDHHGRASLILGRTDDGDADILDTGFFLRPRRGGSL